MQALLLNAESKTASVESRSLPDARPGDVLIKVHAVALNPVDALYVSNPIGRSGRIVGSDFAGTVASAPSSSSSSTNGRQLQQGDKVAGFLQGACSVNDRPGAFAEYLVCPADLVWRVSESVPLESAAAVSLCALTAAQALYNRLGLKAPFDWERLSPLKDKTISASYFFIAGASTSVGMYAAQLIRRSAEVSGETIKLIGAASSARFDLLRAEPYAYDALVDYRDEDWPEQVRQHTGGVGVTWAFDCISEGSTVRDVSRTLCKGGKIAIVRSKEYGAWETDGLPDSVEPSYGAVWEGLGEEVEYDQKIIPASTQARSFTVAFYNWLSDVGRLEANPIRLMPGGLDRVVPDGFALLGTGSMGDRAKSRPEPYMKPISAEKLVYRIES